MKIERPSPKFFAVQTDPVPFDGTEALMAAEEAAENALFDLIRDAGLADARSGRVTTSQVRSKRDDTAVIETYADFEDVDESEMKLVWVTTRDGEQGSVLVNAHRMGAEWPVNHELAAAEWSGYMTVVDQQPAEIWIAF